MNIEKREIAWKGLTLRSADDAGASTVEGVAVPALGYAVKGATKE